MIDSQLMSHVGRAGFAEPATVVHLFIGGSELHGAKVGTTDDLDLYGVRAPKRMESGTLQG